MAIENEILSGLSLSDKVSLIGAAGTAIFSGVVAWFVSAANARRTMARKELSYNIKTVPLLDKNLFKEIEKLEIKYKDEMIDELVYLELDILNSGNVALEKPPIKIESKDSTYIIPAYIDEIPNGYEDHWDFEREDGETCKLVVDHINPGQVIKARFLMDDLSDHKPVFSCPMPNLKIKEVSDLKVSPMVLKVLESLYPSLSSAIKLLTK